MLRHRIRPARRGPLRRVTLVLGLAFVLAPARAGAEWVEWIAEAGLDTVFTDNLSQTGFDADEPSDFVFTPRLSVGRVFQAAESTRLSGTVDVEGDLHARFDRLNAVRYGVTLAAHHKFGLGRTKPWARVHVSGARYDLKEHGRDSWLYEGGLQLGKRFGPRFDASIAYAYEAREGESGRAVVPGFADDVWDQERHRVTAEANFLVTDLLLFTGGLEYLHGDFESACPKSEPAGGGPGGPPGPGPGPGPGPAGPGGGPGGFLAIEKPEAAVLDEVFGNAPGDCMYRIDGEIYAAYLTFDYPLTDRIAVDLGYRFQHGDGRVLHYQSHIGRLGLTFRY